MPATIAKHAQFEQCCFFQILSGIHRIHNNIILPTLQEIERHSQEVSVPVD